MKQFSHKDYISISCLIGSTDFQIFQAVVNKGIDSHLQAFTESKFFPDCGRYYFHFHRSELDILNRRLTELSTDTENYYPEFLRYVEQWIEDIANYDSLVSD